MRYASAPVQGRIFNENRHEMALMATIRTDSVILPATLVNLSRHGFRIEVDKTFAFGQQITLVVAGWPTLSSHVVWSQGGRTGCTFDMPPSVKAFAMMSISADGIDRHTE